MKINNFNFIARPLASFSSLSHSTIIYITKLDMSRRLHRWTFPLQDLHLSVNCPLGGLTPVGRKYQIRQRDGWAVKKLTLKWWKTFGTQSTSIGLEKKFEHCSERNFLKVWPLDFGWSDRKDQGKVMMLCSILFGEAQYNNLLIVFRRLGSTWF